MVGPARGRDCGVRGLRGFDAEGFVAHEAVPGVPAEMEIEIRNVSRAAQGCAAEGGMKRTPSDVQTKPIGGDVVRKGTRSRFVVSGPAWALKHSVFYRTKPGGTLQSCWYTTWSRWTRDAEVIRVAQPGEKP